MTERSEDMDVPLERRVGRLAAGWKLRALTLEQAGVALAVQCLRECAEELEAAMQQREPVRTSWYRHEDAAAEAAEILRADAESLRMYHTINGEWPDSERATKETHDRWLDIAALLTPNVKTQGQADGEAG